MPTRRLFVAIVAAAFALAGLMPVVAVAAPGPDVTGTIALGDGTPMDGVTVYVTIEGNDMVWSTHSDARGAWGLATGVQAGQTLHVRAERIDLSTPDPEGCLSSLGYLGQADVTVEALPLAPIAITVAPGPSAVTCAATGTPQIGPTPPATDTPGAGQAGSGSVLLLIVGLGTVLLLAVGPVRRPSRRR